MTWKSLVPYANFQDPAHEDTENPPVPHKTKWGTSQDRVFTMDNHAYRVSTKQDRVFVPGANLVAEAPWSVAEWAVALRFDNPRATVLVLVLG